jgi:hypothetical protein
MARGGSSGGDQAMHFQDITMILFAACNGIRVVAHLPQIHKAFTHRNGASAISRTTWGLFLIANVSAVAYAIVNRSDYLVGSLLRRERYLLRSDSARNLFGRSSLSHLRLGFWMEVIPTNVNFWPITFIPKAARTRC